MPKCPKCGAEYTEEIRTCPACGESVENDGAEQQSTDTIETLFAKLSDTTDTTDSYDEKDIDDNKIFSIFAYLGFLVLIPTLLAQNSPFAKYHANQGLVLLVAEIIAAAVSTVLWFIPFVGIILGLLVGLPVYLCTVVLMVIGILNAYGGKAKELPFIGKFNVLK